MSGLLETKAVRLEEAMGGSIIDASGLSGCKEIRACLAPVKLGSEVFRAVFSEPCLVTL